MKNILLVLTSLLFAFNAVAEECRLEQPLPMAADFMVRELNYKNVKVSSDPRFSRPEKYVPAQDVLGLKIFNINMNDKKLNYVGVQLGIIGKLESVGFSHLYSGNFLIQGRSNEAGGVKTYQTREVRIFTETQHAKNEAVTQTTLTVAGGKIWAISLIAPVFKVWKIENGSTYMAFTGEHQTLCVKSAE